MMRALILIAMILAVAACGSRNAARNATTNVELPYEADLDWGEDRRDITVRVENEGDGLEEVRESVRFEATKYCLLNFGGSDTEWDIDPETADWAFVQDGDELIFTGRCSVR